jgi:hypothetical protein
MAANGLDPHRGSKITGIHQNRRWSATTSVNTKYSIGATRIRQPTTACLVTLRYSPLATLVFIRRHIGPSAYGGAERELPSDLFGCADVAAST